MRSDLLCKNFKKLSKNILEVYNQTKILNTHYIETYKFTLLIFVAFLLLLDMILVFGLVKVENLSLAEHSIIGLLACILFGGQSLALNAVSQFHKLSSEIVQFGHIMAEESTFLKRKWLAVKVMAFEVGNVIHYERNILGSLDVVVGVSINMLVSSDTYYVNTF